MHCLAAAHRSDPSDGDGDVDVDVDGDGDGDGDGDAQREQLFLTQGSFSDIWVFYILKDWSLFWKETHRKVWLKFGEHKTFDISLRKDEES